MKRAFLLTTLAIAGCSGLQGTLEWQGEPAIRGRELSGTVRNTTSATVDVREREIRFLDDDGRSVKADKVHITDQELDAGETTRIRASWRGKRTPTRLDYGAGTLQFP
jgi:hypothetical protein